MTFHRLRGPVGEDAHWNLAFCCRVFAWREVKDGGYNLGKRPLQRPNSACIF
jgi:hypothetical protein